MIAKAPVHAFIIDSELIHLLLNRKLYNKLDRSLRYDPEKLTLFWGDWRTNTKDSDVMYIKGSKADREFIRSVLQLNGQDALVTLQALLCIDHIWYRRSLPIVHKWRETLQLA